MPATFMSVAPSLPESPAFTVDVPNVSSNVQTSGYFHTGMVSFEEQHAPHLERWQTTLQQAVTNGRHYP